MNDLISRQAVIDLWEQYHPYIAIKACEYDAKLRQLPSIQPEAKTNANGDWVILNKDKILKAGMEGREVDFRIGGRLFAIREKAQ